jgi:hypothetical protein
MRQNSAAWERAAEVHEAAQGWLRVGAIDEPTGHAIREVFPDPCVTPSAVWRVLTACVVAAVILCTFGAFLIAFSPVENELVVLCFLFAGASLIGADLLEASPRFARRGAAGAASFLGVSFLLAGFEGFLVVNMEIFDLDAVLIASVLAWAVSCWRWGSPLFAALSALSLFLFLGRMPYGRVLWVLVGAALTGLAGRRLDEASWAPSHRRGAAVLVVAGIMAAYAAVNVYSFEAQLLEYLGIGAIRIVPRIVPSRGLVVLSALATAVAPLAVLAWGARSRRTFLLDTGIVLLALSLVTLRHYVHIAPLWAMLILSGAALVVLALAVERALRRAPAGDIAGFTADPLFSNEQRQHALQVVPVVAAFTSTAPGPAAQEEDFTGGGGKFGGGGAGEKF